MAELYKPLYPPEGAPVMAFVCLTCQEPTRTAKGMRIHLWRKHELKEQIEIPFSEEKDGPSGQN